MISLPPPAPNQPYCIVSALEGGKLDLPLHICVANANKEELVTVPVLSFILHHSVTNDHLVFDLGIRKDVENYHPAMQGVLLKFFPNVTVKQDVVESLEKGGYSPVDIKTICLSHCHFDHVGNPQLFPKATFLLGSESVKFLPGYPEDEKSLFSKEWFPWDRVKYLVSENWTSLGPFPRAFDYYGDGSLYLIDAPGHCPGHLNLLARSSSDGAWIYLAADSVHHWSLIKNPKARIASTVDENGHHVCMHADVANAEATISRIRALMKIPRVQIILAHDEEWYHKNEDGPSFWPGRISSL